MKVRVFTDGACSENPGPGGWSAVFAMNDKVKVISGNAVETTNNRMELYSVIKAIAYAVKNRFDELVIHSDSSYVVNAINSNWLGVWKKKGWVNAKKEEVKNKDLWQILDKSLQECDMKIVFVKVKGHNGNTFNEIADRRAKEEVLKAKLKKG